MLNVIVEAKPERTPERKKGRFLLFSSGHRNALMGALANEGVHGDEAELVIEQVKRLAASAAKKMSDEDDSSEGMTAIVEVDRAVKILDRTYEFFDMLHLAEDLFDRDIHRHVGRCIVRPRRMPKSNLRRKGRRAMEAAGVVAEYLYDTAASASQKAVARVFEGGNSDDRLLRELCRAVHDCWEAATSSPLPTVNPRWGDQTWAHADVSLLNPLWIVLDSVNVQIGKRALNCLVAYANGEPVSSAQLD
jgi:hypothetical protein